MAERHQRCAYWPHCAIHLGQPRPPFLSANNIAQIGQDYLAGQPAAAIAAELGISVGYVYNVLAQTTTAEQREQLRVRRRRYRQAAKRETRREGRQA